MEQPDQEIYFSVITRRAIAVLLPILLALGLLITCVAIVRAQSSGLAVSPAVPMDSVTAAGDVYTLSLPVVAKPAPDVYGYVHYNGQPVPELTVRLNMCQLVGRWTACGLIFATTDPSGMYGFFNIPPTDATHWNSVEYLRADQTNQVPDNSLISWYQEVTYTGVPRDLGIWDIRSIAPVTPTDGMALPQPYSTLSVTLQFTWTPRTALSETYHVFLTRGNYPTAPYSVLYDGDEVGYSGVFSHEFAYSSACLPDVYEPAGQPCAASVLRPGELYQWQVAIRNEHGAGVSQGFTFTLPAIP